LGGPVHECGWFPGNPPPAIDMKLVSSECMRELETNVYDGYFLVQIVVRNGCGSVTQNALVLFQPAPSGAQVNFGLLGSNPADAYADYGNDELNPGNGQSSSSDGFLSWGGTAANPTWAGALSIALSGFNFENFYGGLEGYEVKVEDVTDINAMLQFC